VEDAEELITHEVERLLTVVAPMFVNYPMPVNPTTARLVVGVSAGGAALLEEIDAIAAVVSAGATVPSAPILLAADFAALVMEAYVAASVRVRQLDRLGRPVVGEEVARDLAQALTGAGPSSGREATQDMAAGIAKRLIKRWVVGVTPFAGIAYDGWDAQKTVTAILRMPLPELED
jgi:hypothetical protein